MSVRSHRSAKSYAAVAKKLSTSQPAPNIPLTGSNCIPVSRVSGSNRLPLRQNGSVFDRISLPRTSAFDRLDFSSVNPSNKQFSPFGDRSSQPTPVNSPAKNTEEHPSNLNVELNLGNSSSTSISNGDQSKGSGNHAPVCSHCLCGSHERRNCTNSIKCHACNCWGHVALSCRFQLKVRVKLGKSKRPKERDFFSGSSLSDPPMTGGPT